MQVCVVSAASQHWLFQFYVLNALACVSTLVLEIVSVRGIIHNDSIDDPTSRFVGHFTRS